MKVLDYKRKYPRRNEPSTLRNDNQPEGMEVRLSFFVPHKRKSSTVLTYVGSFVAQEFGKTFDSATIKTAKQSIVYESTDLENAGEAMSFSCQSNVPHDAAVFYRFRQLIR